MGGKTGTTTQSVQIPPEVLARYNSVNATAEKAAATPFKEYSTDPNAFVAPLNEQQNAGINNINQQANAAQPGYRAAMAGTANAAQGFNAQNYQQGVQAYMNPYLQNAMGSTAAYLQNQNQQQQNQLQGNAISSGAFGGDRGKVGQAALMGQQNLAMGQTLGQMANQGYQQSAQNYMTGLQQQGALANQYGNLAGQAQQMGLAGAQAQLGAGTLGQQTTQAGNTALYNQFLQQQAYPFQTAQFLANIAEGTGALSGSNTTTTQPMSFFSDRRLKHDIKRVGTAENGLPIYKFKYKGDDSEQTHVGFMADEVEKVHPEAVGLAGGYKTVDYDKASEPVHKYAGGLVSEGGAVGMGHAGEGYADGGYADYYDPNSIQNIISRHQGMYANIDSHHVPMSRSLMGGLGKHGRVPEASLPIGSLKTAGPVPAMPESTLKQGLGAASEATDFATKGKDFYDWLKKQHAFDPQSNTPSSGETVNAFSGQDKNISGNAYGGRIHGYALGGDALTDPNKKDGGTPEGLYSADQSGTLNIPNENKMNKLMQASGPTGTMQDPTMADIQKMAAMAAMFMKAHGGSVGREHHAEGDVVGEKPIEITPDYVRNIAAKSAAAAGLNPTRPLQIGQLESAFNHNAVGDEGSSFGPYQMHYGNMSQKYPHGGLGDVFTKETGYDLRDPNVRKDPKVIQANADWVMDYMKKHGDSAWSTSRQLSSKPDLNADMPVRNAQPAQAIVSEKTKQEGGLFPKDSENWIIPALTGLGAMASSNSPFLGSAILQGLGAGAQSYLTTAQKKAAIGQTLQETEAIKSEMAKGAFQPGQRGNIMWVKGPNGVAYPMAMSEYQNLRKAGRAPEIAFQQGAEGAEPAQPYQVPEGGEATTAPTIAPTEIGGAQHPLYDGTSHTAAQNEQTMFDPTVGGPAIDTNYKLSDKYIGDVSKEANAARANGRNVQELSSNLANAVTLKGGSTPGPTFDARAYAFGLANVAARAAGLPQIDNADSVEAISSKVSAIQQFMLSHGSDQNSLGALNVAKSTVPNPNMPPEAFAPLAAMLMVQQKRAIDAKNHADNWAQDSGGTYLGASKDFSRKTAQVYADDQNALAAIMLKSPKMFQQFMNGKDNQGNPIDESRMTNVLKAAGYNPRVAKYFVLGE